MGDVAEEIWAVKRGEEKEVVNVPEGKYIVNAPEDNDVVNATTMGQIMDMDTATFGSHIATMYGRRWYIGRLVKEVDDIYNVTYMTYSRGKWKWGSSDQGLVDKETVLYCQ